MDLIIAFGDSEMAQATYDLIHPHVNDSGATGTGLVFLSGSAHWPLGRLAALLGRAEEALSHFAAAVTIDTRLGATPLVVLSRLDMPGPVGRAEHLVNDLDRAIRAGDPLTRREREIAELVSAGITNRAIATQLVLSERTVEGHVRRSHQTATGLVPSWQVGPQAVAGQCSQSAASHRRVHVADCGYHAWPHGRLYLL